MTSSAQAYSHAQASVLPDGGHGLSTSGPQHQPRLFSGLLSPAALAATVESVP